MAARTIEDRLARVHACRGAADRAAALRELMAALRTRTGLLVAAAAPIAVDDGHDEAIAELPDAFARLCDDAIKRDPGCRGKLAIARAILERGRWDDLFERGIRLVQPEPAFGGPADTAAPLRAMCALAHAQLGHRDAVDAIAELLADREPAARLGAAQALGDTGRPDAIPLLRYKAMIGDDEPEVRSAILASLLALEPERSLAFVAGFLDRADATAAEAAALALGESRLGEALPLLVAWTDAAVTPEHRRIGCVAIALLRLDAATAWLLDRIRHGPAPFALAALEALASFRHDDELAARVADAVDASRDRETARAATRLFGPRE